MVVKQHGPVFNLCVKQYRTHFTSIESKYDRFNIRHYSNTTSTVYYCTGKAISLVGSSKVVERRNLAGLGTLWLI
jgi:hypothetical protein